VIRPATAECNDEQLGKVIGCGLLLNPEDQLSIFFTDDGILSGQLFLGKLLEWKTHDINLGKNFVFTNINMYCFFISCFYR
jgi:hypothetical protein